MFEAARCRWILGEFRPLDALYKKSERKFVASPSSAQFYRHDDLALRMGARVSKLIRKGQNLGLTKEDVLSAVNSTALTGWINSSVNDDP